MRVPAIPADKARDLRGPAYRPTETSKAAPKRAVFVVVCRDMPLCLGCESSCSTVLECRDIERLGIAARVAGVAVVAVCVEIDHDARLGLVEEEAHARVSVLDSVWLGEPLRPQQLTQPVFGPDLCL